MAIDVLGKSGQHLAALENEIHKLDEQIELARQKAETLLDQHNDALRLIDTAEKELEEAEKRLKQEMHYVYLTEETPGLNTAVRAAKQREDQIAELTKTIAQQQDALPTKALKKACDLVEKLKEQRKKLQEDYQNANSVHGDLLREQGEGVLAGFSAQFDQIDQQIADLQEQLAQARLAHRAILDEALSKLETWPVELAKVRKRYPELSADTFERLLLHMLFYLDTLEQSGESVAEICEKSWQIPLNYTWHDLPWLEGLHRNSYHAEGIGQIKARYTDLLRRYRENT